MSGWFNCDVALNTYIYIKEVEENPNNASATVINCHLLFPLRPHWSGQLTEAAAAAAAQVNDIGHHITAQKSNHILSVCLWATWSFCEHFSSTTYAGLLFLTVIRSISRFSHTLWGGRGQSQGGQGQRHNFHRESGTAAYIKLTIRVSRAPRSRPFNVSCTMKQYFPVS